MSLTQQVFNYCERASDPSLWAEPLNAITNIGFIVASVYSYFILRQQPLKEIIHYILIALVFIIGVGSTLFHTFATRWSLLTDVLPIVAFIYLYFTFTLYRFIGLKILGCLFGLGVFIGFSYYVGMIKCEGGECLNGTIAYVPALVALFVFGLILSWKQHKAAFSFFLAGFVFFVSASLRTYDFELCHSFSIANHSFGSHFLWHLLNSVTLFILLRAAILFGQKKV